MQWELVKKGAQRKKEGLVLFLILEDRVHAVTLANQQTPKQIKKVPEKDRITAELQKNVYQKNDFRLRILRNKKIFKKIRLGGDRCQCQVTLLEVIFWSWQLVAVRSLRLSTEQLISLAKLQFTLQHKHRVKICNAISKIHVLTGCDATSKTGTNAAALKVNCHLLVSLVQNRRPNFQHLNKLKNNFVLFFTQNKNATQLMIYGLYKEKQNGMIFATYF